MDQPLVSCIMPTANREKYIPYAINYFLDQDYPNKELVIIDDGLYPIASLVPDDPRIHYEYKKSLGSIGLKRNYACKQAKGEIIMHWDDDDWHASDWITVEVYFLLTFGVDMVGIQHINYYSAINNQFNCVMRRYLESNPLNWVHGATLAYWKSFWEKHPFKDLNAGEDDDFINNSGGQVYIHDYRNGFVCILHPNNTITRNFENPKYKKTKI